VAFASPAIVLAAFAIGTMAAVRLIIATAAKTRAFVFMLESPEEGARTAER
jgi:hypothetical protein